MAAKFVFLFAACLAAAQGAHVRRDAPTTFEQIQKNADEFAKTFNEHLNSLVNSKNTQDLNKVLKDSSDAILQHVSSLSNSLQGAIKDADGKAKEALEKARVELEKTTNDLKKKHPDVEKEANALRERLQNAVQSTLQHTQVLAKEVAANVDDANKQLAPKIKTAYDDFIKQAQEVQKKLHDAATKQ